MYNTFSKLIRIPKWAAWSTVVLWMAVLFRLSALTGSSVPGRFAAPGHFILYAVLSTLIWIAVYRPGHEYFAFAVAVGASSLYGITDEIHQSFVPGRMPDVADWGVDTIGAAIAAGVLIAIAKSASRRPSDDT